LEIYIPIIVPYSGVTDLQIVIPDAVDGGSGRGFIVGCRGIPPREEQGGDQDSNGAASEKGVDLVFSRAFHNQLVIISADRRIIALKLH
jgi:hypothetical protein